MSKSDPKSVYLPDGIEVLNNYELINHLRDNRNLYKSDLLVAFCLASRRNNVTARCFPGKSGISRDTGLSMSGVKLAIKHLEKIGTIVSVNLSRDDLIHDGKTTNSYYFTYDIDYQMGLIEDQEQHPVNKMEAEKELFESAYIKYKRGHS